MNDTDKRNALVYLIKYMCAERGDKIDDLRLPEDVAGCFDIYRALANVREPKPVDRQYLSVQDTLLAALREERGTVAPEEMLELEAGMRLWKGDITRIAADAIVNAANSALLGCFAPLHSCIDNCIHTYAGVQLRLACNDIMCAQGHEEPAGRAKITPAYNLPSKYVLHTVGPVVGNVLTAVHESLLASCYRKCLSLAWENGCRSIAFCCISTGVFRFPALRAAEIAVDTVRRSRPEDMQVIFNVFTDDDEGIYRSLLGVNS